MRNAKKDSNLERKYLILVEADYVFGRPLYGDRTREPHTAWENVQHNAESKAQTLQSNPYCKD